jgi:hypothetical protein
MKVLVAVEAVISVLAVVVLSLVLDFSKENLRKTKKAE